jgi:hypothetical protein
MNALPQKNIVTESITAHVPLGDIEQWRITTLEIDRLSRELHSLRERLAQCRAQIAEARHRHHDACRAIASVVAQMSAHYPPIDFRPDND